MIPPSATLPLESPTLIKLQELHAKAEEQGEFNRLQNNLWNAERQAAMNSRFFAEQIDELRKLIEQQRADFINHGQAINQLAVAFTGLEAEVRKLKTPQASSSVSNAA